MEQGNWSDVMTSSDGKMTRPDSSTAQDYTLQILLDLLSDLTKFNPDLSTLDPGEMAVLERGVRQLISSLPSGMRFRLLHSLALSLLLLCDSTLLAKEGLLSVSLAINRGLEKQQRSKQRRPYGDD